MTPRIEPGQRWRRKSDGVEVEVMRVRDGNRNPELDFLSWRALTGKRAGRVGERYLTNWHRDYDLIAEAFPVTARTPRTTREEREGLREAAERPPRFDAARLCEPHPSLPYVHRALVEGALLADVIADLRDAEDERDAAVERAERAEAAVGRVREATDELDAWDDWVEAPQPLSSADSDSNVMPAYVRVADLRAALDPATDAETGRGGAGRSRPVCRHGQTDPCAACAACAACDGSCGTCPYVTTEGDA